MSVSEAAEALGVSEKTIRRRIKGGMLAAFQVPTSQGYEWRVQLDGEATQLPGAGVQVDGPDVHPPGQDAAHVDSGHGMALLHALELADRLQAGYAKLQRENVELAGRCGFLQAKLQEAEGKILALDTPKQPQPARPSLWRRLFSPSPAYGRIVVKTRADIHSAIVW